MDPGSVILGHIPVNVLFSLSDLRGTSSISWSEKGERKNLVKQIFWMLTFMKESRKLYIHLQMFSIYSEDSRNSGSLQKGILDSGRETLRSSSFHRGYGWGRSFPVLGFRRRPWTEVQRFAGGKYSYMFQIKKKYILVSMVSTSGVKDPPRSCLIHNWFPTQFGRTIP